MCVWVLVHGFSYCFQFAEFCSGCICQNMKTCWKALNKLLAPPPLTHIELCKSNQMLNTCRAFAFEQPIQIVVEKVAQSGQKKKVREKIFNDFLAKRVEWTTKKYIRPWHTTLASSIIIERCLAWVIKLSETQLKFRPQIYFGSIFATHVRP